MAQAWGFAVARAYVAAHRQPGVVAGIVLGVPWLAVLFRGRLTASPRRDAPGPGPSLTVASSPALRSV